MEKVIVVTKFGHREVDPQALAKSLIEGKRKAFFSGLRPGQIPNSTKTESDPISTEKLYTLKAVGPKNNRQDL